MHLTLHSDFSLRILIYLAVHQDRLVSTSEISKAYGISKNHLVRVVQTLGRHDFIEIYPGRAGGIKLAHEPANISIGEVLRQTEPDFNVAECFDEKHNNCPITPVCGLKSMLKDATNNFLKTLDAYTLADVVKSPTQQKFALYFLQGKKNVAVD